MAHTNIDSQALGILLLIKFNRGYVNEFNADVGEFESVAASFQDPEGATARDFRFLMCTGNGPSSVQGVDPGASSAAFISSDKSTVAEKIAQMKEINVALEVDQATWERALQAPQNESYVKPIELEQYNKMIAAKQYQAANYYADGTGVLATATATSSVSGGNLIVTVYNAEGYRGYFRWARIDEKVNFYSSDGTTVQEPSVSGGATFSYFKIVDVGVSVSAPTLTLTAYNAAGTALTVTAANAIGVGDLLYKAGQDGQLTLPDLSSTVSADYGTLTVVAPGLETLSAADGRLVHGVTMSGLTKGSHVNVGSSTSLYWDHLAEALDLAKEACGEEVYKYDTFKCSYAASRHLININEGQKFLLPGQDKRGHKALEYWHRNTVAKMYVSRYCPDYRIYFEPMLAKADGTAEMSKDQPIQMRFTKWKYFMTPGSNDAWNWKIVSGSRVKTMESHMQSFGTFIVNRPAAIAVVKNFGLS